VIPVADAAVAPAKTTPRRRNLRLACDCGELVSTTLSVADPLRDLGPRAISVFCMTVSSRLLTALFVVVCAQRGFVATAGHPALRDAMLLLKVALASVRSAKPIAGEQKPTNKFGLCRKRARLLPLGETGRALAGATNIHNQYPSEFVATYDEEQPRQHRIRRSMPPMAPFPQSVFR